MTRQEIFDAIVAERQYQNQKWGVSFDKKNTLNDWASYITTYTGKITAFGADEATSRSNLLKVAALAVAALEQETFAPRHYDTQA